MLEHFFRCSYTLQALIATMFTWSMTALGAAVVFLFRKVNRNLLDGTLGFAAGVMTAASFWSLLDPAISMAEEMNMNVLLTVVPGFLMGGVVLAATECLSTRLRSGEAKNRSMMLIASITLHNIPEGLSVGVAYGALAYGLEGATLMGACMIALGIGLQNLPEGAAVSMPLIREGYTRKRAFFMGQLSGAVEPAAGVLGAVLALQTRLVLPWLLAFSAGAMIYVVMEELIPESMHNKNQKWIALCVMAGFALMMALDVGLS